MPRRSDRRRRGPWRAARPERVWVVLRVRLGGPRGRGCPGVAESEGRRWNRPLHATRSRPAAVGWVGAARVSGHSVLRLFQPLTKLMPVTRNPDNFDTSQFQRKSPNRPVEKKQPSGPKIKRVAEESEADYKVYFVDWKYEKEGADILGNAVVAHPNEEPDYRLFRVDDPNQADIKVAKKRVGRDFVEGAV